jgi:hypothetical protein
MHKLVIFLATILSAFPVAAHATMKCESTPLTQIEAKSLIELAPMILRSKRHGAKIDIIRWKPGKSVARAKFHTFMVATTEHRSTVLSNGLIGYFGVNKWTGDVLQLDNPGGPLIGKELSQAQAHLIRSHCLMRRLKAERVSSLRR